VTTGGNRILTRNFVFKMKPWVANRSIKQYDFKACKHRLWKGNALTRPLLPVIGGQKYTYAIPRRKEETNWSPLKTSFQFCIYPLKKRTKPLQQARKLPYSSRFFLSNPTGFCLMGLELTT
jgi:hypothetical protein